MRDVIVDLHRAGALLEQARDDMNLCIFSPTEGRHAAAQIRKMQERLTSMLATIERRMPGGKA